MRSISKRTCLSAAVFALIVASAAPCFARVRIRPEAFCGKPFGVGRLVVDLSEDELPFPLGFEGLGLSEKNGRVLYPATDVPAVGPIVFDILDQTPAIHGGPIREEVGGLLRELLGSSPRATIYFLFEGKAPLQVTLQGRRPHRFTIQPRVDADDHASLLDAWWRTYTATPGVLRGEPDYPPLVDTFLTTTLARRLNLKLPERKQTESWQDQLAEQVGLTLGTEAIRVAMQQDRILGLNHLDQTADQPLPEPIIPSPLDLPKVAAEVPIEPIAMRVPRECLYVRFGSFSNFLWFQDTLKKWGGDAQNLIASRGLDLETQQRIEQQLVVKQTALSRILGPTVVADVAIIGTDLYLREGAAFGLLFYAKNSTALALDLTSKRIARLKAGGVTEQKLTVAGQKVSYLSSPDGTVRSYYVSDGAYQFVTTSKTLARRFIETGTGGGSLGASEEFCHARSLMPLKENYAAFVYFSDAFFRNLVGPQYRVETARRLQAASDIDLVQLARLAAAREGKPNGTIEELSGSGILPRDFGPRPDGTRTVLAAGRAYDSLRGHRGTFLPIGDVPVTRVSPAEAAAYRKFADFYAKHLGRIDPVMIGVRRKAIEEGLEWVQIDARMSPLRSKLRQLLTEQAGAADELELAALPGDLASGELIMKDRRVFAGLRDFGPPLQNIDGRLSLLGRPRDMLVGYVGTDGPLPWLRWIENVALVPPDPRKPGDTPGGLFSRPWKQYTVYSLHPEVLEAVLPRLEFQKATRPAQFRLQIGDISRARMTPWLNAWGYMQTQQTSLGNLRLMHALDQQLCIPAKDCKQTAEFLLGAKLICPLGGKYVFLARKAEGESGQVEGGSWTSTALVDDAGRSLLGAPPPAGYRAPPLSWFRGLDLDALVTQGALTAHADVIMQLPQAE